MGIKHVLVLPIMALGLAGCGGFGSDTTNEEVNEEVNEKDLEKLVEEQVNTTLQQQMVTNEKATNEQPVSMQQEQVTTQTKVQTVKVEEDHSAVTHVQVTANDANIREQASLNSQVVYAGTMHETFDYLKEKVHMSDGRIWYKVSYDSGVGYMSSAVSTLIHINQVMSTANNGGNSIIITSSDGNVRAEPSLNGAVIYKGKEGDELQYTGDVINSSDGRVWYKVMVNGKIGFISKKVASLSEDYYYGLLSKTEFLITSTEGNVRAQPSMNSQVIYSGSKGESLYYTGYYENTSDGRTWYEVEISGTYGYISGKVGHVQ